MMDNPLKVLLIGPSIEGTPGGMATVLRELLAAAMPGVRFRHLQSHTEGRATQKLALAARALADFARSDDFDVVHIHVASGASFYRKSLFVLAAQQRRKPVILHVHGADFDAFFQRALAPMRWYIRRIFACCARVVVLSESWRSFFHQYIIPTGVVVLPNGVDARRFASAGPAAAPHTFLFLGRLGARKGVYDLLAAVAQVRQARPDTPLQVLLAGDGEEAEVQQLIDQQNLQAQVTVLGWVGDADKPALFRRAATLVLPSYHEGLPMALLEAMAAGLVVVSTHVGGIPELVEEGVNGFLLQPGDVTGLAQHLQRLMEQPDLVREIAARNREKIQQHYNLPTLNQHLRTLYQELADGRP